MGICNLAYLSKKPCRVLMWGPKAILAYISWYLTFDYASSAMSTFVLLTVIKCFLRIVKILLNGLLYYN